MTAAEMIPAIGAQVLVDCGGLNVACLVRDVKISYGRPRLLIMPVSGEGQVWIELSRLRRGLGA